MIAVQYVRLVRLGSELGADVLAVEACWPEEVQEEVLEGKGGCTAILSFTDPHERFYSAGELRMTLAIMANAWGMRFICASTLKAANVPLAVSYLHSFFPGHLIWLMRQARCWMPCKL